MGFQLSAVIARADLLVASEHPSFHAPQVLEQGFALRAVDKEAPGTSVEGFFFLTDRIEAYLAELSATTRAIYVEAEFFGSQGTQTSAGWADGERALGLTHSEHGSRQTKRGWVPYVTGEAANDALCWLGVEATDGQDEFDSVGLSQRRDWGPEDD